MSSRTTTETPGKIESSKAYGSDQIQVLIVYMELMMDVLMNLGKAVECW